MYVFVVKDYCIIVFHMNIKWLGTIVRYDIILFLLLNAMFIVVN